MPSAASCSLCCCFCHPSRLWSISHAMALTLVDFLGTSDVLTCLLFQGGCLQGLFGSKLKSPWFLCNSFSHLQQINKGPLPLHWPSFPSRVPALVLKPPDICPSARDSVWAAMKSFVLLLCLAQLWGCYAAPPAIGVAYREPPCDDPEIEQVAVLAVDYLNKNLLQGFKHALNQIDKVKVWPRRPFGEVYEIEIDTLETTCHALDPTPLANCPAVEGDCDFHVLKQDGQLSVMFAKCHSTPDSAEDVHKACPKCPLLAQLNDSRVVHAVEAALAAFNSKNNGSYLKLVEISRAQLVPLPVSTFVEFAVASTDCVAKEVTDPASCNLLAEKQYGFCKASLHEKLGGEEVAVTCTMFPTQPQPDGASTANAPSVDQTQPAPTPAGPPPASLVVGPMVMSVPQSSPVDHRTHYDLRDAFSSVASVESASGEAFNSGKAPKVTQPGAAVVSGPVVRPCPGRVRHFKI
ncbi:alpha-2-HS-glycoprotein isoform X2 [Perognathus longimembris pacificus]|uniref:alpha-2-HS-glycoprotein isoform X2 n=1 Tax=Perognathus longimembris pacificus TaxID=214514 RepID=UPI0020184207|nr:alpha-2-HS-glycoprotein isoform X2 [Perognathus longimembris pacificus]